MLSNKLICNLRMNEGRTIQQNGLWASHPATEVAARQLFPLKPLFGEGIRSKTCFSEPITEAWFSNMGCS